MFQLRVRKTDGEPGNIKGAMGPNTRPRPKDFTRTLYLGKLREKDNRKYVTGRSRDAGEST